MAHALKVLLSIFGIQVYLFHKEPKRLFKRCIFERLGGILFGNESCFDCALVSAMNMKIRMGMRRIEASVDIAMLHLNRVISGRPSCG